MNHNKFISLGIAEYLSDRIQSKIKAFAKNAVIILILAKITNVYILFQRSLNN